MQQELFNTPLLHVIAVWTSFQQAWGCALEGQTNVFLLLVMVSVASDWNRSCSSACPLPCLAPMLFNPGHLQLDKQ